MAARAIRRLQLKAQAARREFAGSREIGIPFPRPWSLRPMAVPTDSTVTLRLTEFGETTDNATTGEDDWLAALETLPRNRSRQITNLLDHLQFLAEWHRIELLMLMPPTTRPRRRAPVNFRRAFRDHNSKACRAKDSTHQYRPDQCPVQLHASFRAEFATGRFGR